MTARGQFGGRKIREGTVVSDKMQKTVLVAVEANIRHPLYKKIVRRVRRFMAHDEREDAHTGDRVRIVEASPLSRHKRWRVVEVLTRAELPELAPESIDLDLLGEVKREDDTPETVAAPAANGASEAEPLVIAEEAVSSPEAEIVVSEEVVVEDAEPISAEVEPVAKDEPEVEVEAEPMADTEEETQPEAEPLEGEATVEDEAGAEVGLEPEVGLEAEEAGPDDAEPEQREHPGDVEEETA